MNIIWANRLIAGTKTWAEMPGIPPCRREESSGRARKQGRDHRRGLQSASPVTTMTWPELCEKLLTRLEAQGENMSTERAELGCSWWTVPCAGAGLIRA